MNLTLLYQDNETAVQLLQSFHKEWTSIEHTPRIIQGKNFITININDHQSDYRRSINSSRAIRNCMDFFTYQQILNFNGMAVEISEDELVNRIYEVVVCNLNIVSIKVTTANKKSSPKYVKEVENKKISELARRAMHVIGLDIGMVNIVFTGKRKYKVVSIEPSPILRARDLNYIVQQLKDIYSLNTIQAKIRLGADPEFMLINSRNGKLISASEFFPRDGVVGCDSIRIPNRQQRPIAEVRPNPELSPIELASNIKQALNSASKLVPYRNVKWIAGSQPVSSYYIGGHIHFSNVRMDGILLRALDNYLGLPIFLIENPYSASRRRKKYGYLGDYRVKDHGGFEYRTPGSWLVSQKIAIAVLCLAHIVSRHYTELSENYLNNAEAQRAFYEGNQQFFKTAFFLLWSRLEETKTFQEYKAEVQIIRDMVMEGVYWDEKSDLRKSWKISVPTATYAGSRSASRSASSSISTRSTSSSSRNNQRPTRSLNRSSRNSSSSISVRTPARSNSSTAQRRTVSSSQVRRISVIR